MYRCGREMGYLHKNGFWMNYNLAKRVLRIFLILLLGFFSTMATKMHFRGAVWDGLGSNYMDEFQWTDILIFVAMFGLWYGVYWLVKRYYRNIQKLVVGKKEYKMKSWQIWLIVLGVLVVAWLPYLLSFAPGSVLGDSLSSVEQIFSGEYSNHHPVAYTLLVGVFVKIGVAMGNINIGVFLYTCFQYLLLAATLAYVVMFLAQHKVRPVLLVIAAVFFAICPIFPSYAIIMWKDPIFSIALLFLGIILYEYAKTDFEGLKWYHYALLIFCTLLVAFFRNNGIFILVLVVPMLLILYRKKVWKVALALVLTIGVSLTIQGPMYSMLKIHKPSVEAFAIPLQQMAYTISENEESLSEDDRRFLSEIMPLEVWKKAYTPVLVDTIKWDESFDTIFFESHLVDFMKIWVKNLPGNFGRYVKAYLLETLGFWHPIYQNEYGYIDQYVMENESGIHETDLIEKVTGGSIKKGLEAFRPMLSTGLMVIVMLFSAVICLEFQKKRISLLYLTSVFCWVIIMVSTPVAFSLRYMFVLTLALPIFMVCPFFRLEKTKKTGKGDIIKE